MISCILPPISIQKVEECTGDYSSRITYHTYIYLHSSFLHLYCCQKAIITLPLIDFPYTLSWNNQIYSLLVTRKVFYSDLVPNSSWARIASACYKNTRHSVPHCHYILISKYPFSRLLTVHWYLWYNLSFCDFVERIGGKRTIPGSYNGYAMDPLIWTRVR